MTSLLFSAARSFRRLTALVLMAAGVCAASAGSAHAQNMAASNAAFDARFNNWLSGVQRQNAQAQQQLWQQHLQMNGPRLRQQYAQLVQSGQAVGSFEQFAYWDLMTAGGTNVQGALAHQQAQFQGQQRAHATVMEGNASYNAGWANNSARQTAAVENFGNQAIRGVGPYVDPSSGRTTMLPHSVPAGQVVQSNGSYYAQDASGTYHRWAGNGWVALQAAR